MELDGRHIPNRLKKHRKISGYRQKDVAYLLGHTSTNQLCKWERGEALPSLVNILKLSVIYRTLPTEFYYDLLQEQREEITMKEQKLFQQSSP